MKSLKSRYSLCEIDNNNFATILASGTTRNILGQGYIHAPYIPVMTNTIIVEGDWGYWERIRQIKDRRKKIEKLKEKIWKNSEL